MRIISGYKDTRSNEEDFAITPYLFAVVMRGFVISIYGIGICWGYYSGYIGIGFGLPKDYPSIKDLDK